MNSRAIFVGATALVLLAGALGPEAALAARFHVRVGGERNGGPSSPGDWSIANCYGELAAALAACAPADSVLLYPESHALDVAGVLPALVTNQAMADEPGGTEVVLGALGALAANGTAATCELRGLILRGGAGGRTAAAVTVVSGGALQAVTLANCRFIDLLRAAAAGNGGAAFSAAGNAQGLMITLDQCEFSGNRSPGRGGAVYVGAGYAVTATGCEFTDNAAIDGGTGGALAMNAITAPSNLVAEDCTFTGNQSAGPSGAMELLGTSVSLRRCEVRGSRSAVEAGALFAEGGGMRILHLSGHTDPVTAVLEDCTFEDNRGTLAAGGPIGDGGGLHVRGGLDRSVALAISDCVFRNNFNAQGGGLYVGRFATGTVEYCRFLDNTAWYQGGGAMKGGIEENIGELVTFAYCEFVGNRAGYDGDGVETGEYSRGGGVMVRNSPRAYLYNCTFVDNTVNNSGYAIGDGFAHAIEGGEWVPENQCSLVNCVFWGAGNDVQARSEDTGGMEVVSHVAAQPGQLVLGLEPDSPLWLADFPFVSPSEFYPTVDSPLIDAGTDLGYARDLPGRNVPSGSAPDIGAYEYHGPVAVDDLVPARSMDLTVSPNPFNPRTTLRARIAESAAVSVAIYDSRGRRVTELFRGVLPAGTHDLRWDGCDGNGHDVAAGTYLARLDVGGNAPVVTKMVLVR